MGNTVEALGYKADVKSRMKESVAGKKDSLVGSVSGGKNAVVGKADALVSRVGGIVPDASQMKDGAAKVGVSKENPLGLAVAGAAVGFVVGTMLPKTNIEDEKLGQTSDEVTAKVKGVGQEALERGKSVAQDTLGAATDTAKDSAGNQVDELASSLQGKAQEVRQTS
jgi:hypothetical protein